MTDPGGIGEEVDAGLSPGTRLGKYEIIRQLGAGGMGAVYEAAHTEIGKRVAVKVLSPAIAAVPGARARFLREAQLTSRVRHPNIVDVTDMGSDAGQTYLVMEFLRGEDLAQRLGRTGPIPAQQLADIMLPVCSAVIEAHKAGITHRDLKPQNIFLAAGPHTTQPKVLDFGISKGNDIAGAGSLTGTGAMIGTPFYLAPEQIMDTRAAGPASDQYALGVIMYECLTGHRPFEAENLFVVFQAIVNGNPVPLGRWSPDVPPALESIVMRAMSVDPKARFPHTPALGRALLPFASPRMRSIWEDAFTSAGDVTQVAPSAAVRDALSGAVAAVSTPGSAPISEPMAARTPTPAGRMITPGPRARGSIEIQTPPGPGPTKRRSVDPLASRGPGAWTMNPSVPDAATDLRPGRSQASKSIAIVGSVVVVGLVAGVVLQRSGSQAPPAPATADTAALHQKSAPAPATVATAPAPAAAPEVPTATETVAGVAPASAAAPAEPIDAVKQPASAEPAPPPTVRAPETYQVSFKVRPDSALIELDGNPVGSGHFESALPMDHARHTVRLTAEGFEDREVTFTDRPPPSVLKLSRATDGDVALEKDSEPPRSFSSSRAGGSRANRRVKSTEFSPGVSAPTLSPSPAQAPAPRSLNPNGAPVID